MQTWREGQPVFFAGTAPLSGEGHINISPKGASGTFRVLGPTTVAYLDLTGSGIETVSHLRENGCIVLMFCAFTGAPKIVRLHGRGRVVKQSGAAFADLIGRFAVDPEAVAIVRGVVVVDVTRIADSCGFVVTQMELVSEREQLFRRAETQNRKHGADWKSRYLQANNRSSIDGLPGLVLDDVGSDIESMASAGKPL